LGGPEAPHRLQFNWNSGAGHCSRARIRAEPIIMNVELAAPKLPLCPSCPQNMRLIRRTQRLGLLLDACTFECRACGVSHFQEYEPAKSGDMQVPNEKRIAAP
jgi:hypothetical protein